MENGDCHEKKSSSNPSQPRFMKSQPFSPKRNLPEQPKSWASYTHHLANIRQKVFCRPGNTGIHWFYEECFIKLGLPCIVPCRVKLQMPFEQDCQKWGWRITISNTDSVQKCSVSHHETSSLLHITNFCVTITSSAAGTTLITRERKTQ